MPPKHAGTEPNDRFDEHALRQAIRQHVGAKNYENWFDQKTTLTVADDELIVGVISPFVLSWMQKQFRSSIGRAVCECLGPALRVRMEVDSQLAAQRGTLPHQSAERTETAPAQVKTPSKRDAACTGGSSPSRRFADLDDFVAGQCNELALTAARQVVQAPAASFNPLYIHAGVGTGKTHLLEGIFSRVRRQSPSFNAVFLTSEAFANYFVQALREHTLPSFRQRFRNVDMLLVDDVDFLDSKRAIQEEFLHTVQQLQSHQRQIVVTSDRHPRLLTKVSEELVTRFLSGLVCRIEAPDSETRLRIVQRKAARLNAEFTPEALEFVAHRFKNNVRELEGAMNCLGSQYALTRKRIGVTAARHVLADLERDCLRIVRLSDIERAVCNLFGVQPKDLKSSRRNRSLTQPRMLAMYLARKHTEAAYAEIGEFFGGRNHSTVMSAAKKVQSWLDGHATIKIASQSRPLDELLESLEQQLLAG